jgi:hypothetical protein
MSMIFSSTPTLLFPLEGFQALETVQPNGRIIEQ